MGDMESMQMLRAEHQRRKARRSVADEAADIARMQDRIRVYQRTGEFPSTESETEEQETMDQGQFQDWVDRGVDYDFNRSIAESVKTAQDRTKALSAMIAQAKIQPESADKMHAIQRAAAMARNLSKALDALAVEINGD